MASPRGQSTIGRGQHRGDTGQGRQTRHGFQFPPIVFDFEKKFESSMRQLKDFGNMSVNHHQFRDFRRSPYRYRCRYSLETSAEVLREKTGNISNDKIRRQKRQKTLEVIGHSSAAMVIEEGRCRPCHETQLAGSVDICLMVAACCCGQAWVWTPQYISPHSTVYRHQPLPDTISQPLS